MPRENSTTRSTVDQTVESTSRMKRHVAETQDNSKQHEEDQPSPPKRQRVSRACDQCRSKKDRCDGVQPTCSTCTFLKRSCSYKSNPKKRGLPTGYIRTLELLWGAAFANVQGSEDTVRTLLRTSSIQSHMAAMIKEGDISDTFMSGWKNSMALKEMERLLAVLEQSDGDPGIVDLDNDPEVGNRTIDQTAAFNGLKSTRWQIPHDSRQISDDAIFSNDSPAMPLTERTYANRPQYRDIGSQTPTERLLKDPETVGPPPMSRSMNESDLRLQLPSNPWCLFDIYFAYTHCSLPIVEKHDILRTAFYYKEGPLQISCNTKGSGNHASLWATLALSSLQNQYASESGGRQDDQTRSDELYSVARRLIPSENGNFELGHIQALLILALVKIGRHDWAAASMLVGHAIRMSYAVGIDKRVPIESETPSRRQKHVFLGCFVLDTMIASQMKRLPELSKEQITEIGFLVEDGLEEWQPWEEPSGFRSSTKAPSSSHPGPELALSTFNRLVSLSCLLNDILHWKHDQENASSQLQLIRRDMDRWVAELSKTCHVNFQDAATPLPPHVLAVHIAYESVFATFLLHSSQYYPVDLSWITEPGKRVLIRPRYIALLRLYLETYGSAATSPLFTVFLNLACCSQYTHSDATPLYPDLDIHPEVDAVSCQLRHMWEGHRRQESVIDLDNISCQRPTRVTHTRPENNTANRSNTEFGTESNLNSNDSWSRIVDNLQQPSSLETPCPSLIPETYTSQASLRWSHTGPSIEDHLRSADLSTPGNPSSMMPPSSSLPLGNSDSRYRPPLPSSNNVINTFGGMELNGYGPERPRIAPDLDALFDELASLDGGDKIDNQPQFMQNLGFAPSVGVSDLFSEYNDLDALLLSPAQQRRGGKIP